DESAVSMDDIDHDLEKLIEQLHNLAGSLAGHQRGGSDQVDEQHCDVALLTARLGIVLQSATRHVFAHIPAELLAEAAPLRHATPTMWQSGWATEIIAAPKVAGGLPAQHDQYHRDRGDRRADNDRQIPSGCELRPLPGASSVTQRYCRLRSTSMSRQMKLQ